MSDDHLRPLPDQPNWRTRANCHPTNRPDTTTPAEWTDRWFTTIWHDWAAQQCATCPVNGPCADEGRDQIGMWAGDAREVSGVQPKTCKWCRGLFVPLWNTEAYCCGDCRRKQKNQDAARARAVARRAVA